MFTLIVKGPMDYVSHATRQSHGNINGVFEYLKKREQEFVAEGITVELQLADEINFQIDFTNRNNDPMWTPTLHIIQQLSVMVKRGHESINILASM